MRISRALLILSVCLLGTLGVWLLGRVFSDPQAAARSSQVAADPVANASAVVPSAPAREIPMELRAKPFSTKRQTRPAGPNPAMTNPNSPVNSADWNENQAWAREFPAEALKWLRSAPQGEQRIAIAEIVGPELAQTDPVAAVQLAEDCLGDGTNPVAQNLLDNIAQQWATQDADTARAWALAKPVGEQRDRLLQRIAFVDSKTHPEQAARLIVEQMSPGPTQDEAAISVLYQWARSDAGAALAWAEAFPAADLRARAIEEVRNAIAISSENKPQGTNPN